MSSAARGTAAKHALPLSSASWWTVMLIGFGSNIEYAVIMPSIWDYVHSLGGSKVFLGLCMAAFSLARMCALPLLGHWADVASRRVVFLLSLVLGMMGSLTYAFARKADVLAMVLVGRLVCGAGAGNTSVTTSYVVASTDEHTRTKGLLFSNGINLLGMVTGPALNIGLARLHWSHGPIEVTPLTAPGFLIFALQVVTLVCIFLFYVEPAQSSLSGSTPALQGDASPAAHPLVFESPLLGSPLASPVLHRGRRRQQLHRRGYARLDDDDDAAGTPTDIDATARPSWRVLLFDQGVICVVLIAFCNNYLLSAMETGLTPLTKENFDFGPKQNSFLFGGIAFVALCSIVAAGVLSRTLQDYTIIMTGQCIEGTGITVALILCGGASFPLWAVLVSSGIIITGLSLNGSPNAAMFSKILDQHNIGDHGYYFGLIQVVNGGSRVIGPLVAGVVLQKTSTNRGFFFALLGPWALVFCVLSMYYSTLTGKKLLQVTAVYDSEASETVVSISQRPSPAGSSSERPSSRRPLTPASPPRPRAPPGEDGVRDVLL